MTKPESGSGIKGPEDFAATFAVSRETLSKLETYAGLLRSWQRTINLVAPSTLDDVWDRHFADSAQLLKLASNPARTWLDIGSGAGFPGLIVAILTAEQGGTRVTLVESDSRKAAFLREVARTCRIVVDILCARAESASTQAKVGKVDVVSARALAPLERLLELAHPFFSSHSIGLFLKGREVQAETDAARGRWAFEVELVPSITSPQGRIAVIRNLSCKPEG